MVLIYIECFLEIEMVTYLTLTINLNKFHYKTEAQTILDYTCYRIIIIIDPQIVGKTLKLYYTPSRLFNYFIFYFPRSKYRPTL